MKTNSLGKRARRGYVSMLMVITTGAILSMLTVYAYRQALKSQAIESQVQLRIDYSEKEDAILRSIVALTPNRAIRAMQSGSNLNDAARTPLRWQNIFTESLVLANARTSISNEVLTSINVPNLRLGNSGDSPLGNPAEIFRAIPNEAGYVSPGINRSLGAGYPPPLVSADANTNARDVLYPIISNLKLHGAATQAAAGTPANPALPVNPYNNFNLWKYPDINFGYARPGDNFVAKRNWWAFSVDVGDHDDNQTLLARVKRNFVLSLYEVPSQLSISAGSFMSLGRFGGTNEVWNNNVNIDGNIFAGKADVGSNSAVNALASRRGMTLGAGSTVDGRSFTGNPFAPGVRENYQATQGPFFPVSLASESGRAAFIPISRGAEFFDRFMHAAETNVLSTTTWNNYTIGALQAAMQMDIIATVSTTDLTPARLRFTYLLPNGTRSANNFIELTTTTQPTIPQGYVKVVDENQSYNFTDTVDIAYGASGGFTFRNGITGPVTFNNATFGDPLVGTLKGGYWRPKSPYAPKTQPNGQRCISIFPERLPAFLASMGGAAPVGPPLPVVGPFGSSNLGGAFYNNSMVVNVDYTVNGLNNAARRPSIPCTNTDYGLIMRECSNLTAFTKGFSLVTNLRLYVGDDFNIVPTTPPTGYTPTITASNPTGRYLPPCSLFAPELRYGADVDPFAVKVGGQVGSLAQVDKINAADAEPTMVRPLDSKFAGGTLISSNRVTINLSQIRHPAELPPISMMNWLLLLEERKQEYY